MRLIGVLGGFFLATTLGVPHFLVNALLQVQLTRRIIKCTGRYVSNSPNHLNSHERQASKNDHPETSSDVTRLASTNISASEYGDIQRYKNRAALTEHALKSQRNDMIAIQGKLLILQDVVGKLKIKAETKSQEATHWKRQHLDGEMMHQEAQSDMKRLTHEYQQGRRELEEQTKDYQRDLNAFKQAYDSERRRWQEEQMKHTESEKDLRLKIKALQQELLDMDASFELTQEQLLTKQQHLKREKTVTQQALHAECLTSSSLRKDIAEARLERDEALIRTRNQTTMEESMEIAKASVTAAERRESDIRVECEMLQIYILKLGAEKEILNKRLEVAQKQRDKVDKELRNVKDLSTERDSLRAEVALLKKQVETAESQYADTGNKDEFQFEKEVDMMQDEYKNRERELELLLEERTSYRILRLWQRFRERFKRRGQKRNSKI
jgi:hypothetical protein